MEAQPGSPCSTRRRAGRFAASGFLTAKTTQHRGRMDQTESRAGLSVILVDDEPLARDSLRIALSEDPTIRILDECSNGTEAVESILRNKPDVVFLDIEMPELDGFGVIQAIGVDRMPAVVFVTAFHAHA